MKSDTRIEEPVEFGEKPFKVNCKADWDSVWENAKKGNLEAIPANIRIKHYNTIMKIYKDNLVM